MKKILLTVFASAFLHGCGPQIQSHVTRFHDNFDTHKTVVVLPTDKQKNNLEYKQIASSVAAQLEQHGMTPASESKADYAAFVSYGIDDGKMVTSAVPIMGQTGGGTTYHSGSVNTFGSGGSGFGSYSGTSYTPATFGVVGMAPVSSKQYTRFLKLDIYDLKSSRKDPKKVYEGTVKSEGSTGVFSAISDCLVQALFKDFPGVSGKTTSLTVSGDTCMSTQ